jgi:hypothetical protein
MAGEPCDVLLPTAALVLALELGDDGSVHDGFSLVNVDYISAGELVHTQPMRTEITLDISTMSM